MSEFKLAFMSSEIRTAEGDGAVFDSNHDISLTKESSKLTEWVIIFNAKTSPVTYTDKTLTPANSYTQAQHKHTSHRDGTLKGHRGRVLGVQSVRVARSLAHLDRSAIVARRLVRVSVHKVRDIGGKRTATHSIFSSSQ